MPEIDARVSTGELDLRLILHTERDPHPILDIEFAKGVTVNGSPDAFREFARELLDLVDMTCPPARQVYDNIPPHNGLDDADPDDTPCDHWSGWHDEGAAWLCVLPAGHEGHHAGEGITWTDEDAAALIARHTDREIER